LLVGGVGKADVVGLDHVEVTEILPLEVCFLDDVCFFAESGEVADEG
jgi:hypothetical protein